MNKKMLILNLFMIFALSMVSAFAKMGEGVDLNNFKMHFQADAGIGYDDNVFFEPNNEQSDTMYNFKVYTDIEHELRTPEEKIYLSYEGDYLRYSDFSSEDSDNHDLVAGLEMVFRDVYLTLKDEYTETENINGILFSNRVKRTLHEPSILLGVDLNNIALEGKYAKLFRRYDFINAGLDYEFFDHDKDNYTGSFIYHAFTKTDLFLELEYSEIDYINSERDGDYMQYALGVKGPLTSKTKGTIKAGYQDRDYDFSTQNYKNLIAEADVDLNFTEDMKLNLNYLLTANESIILEYSYYEIDRLSINFFSEKMKDFYLGVGGFYELNDFPNEVRINRPDREDDVSNFYLRVGYDFNDWLSVEVKYDYLQRDSNYDEYDYRQHNIALYALYTL